VFSVSCLFCVGMVAIAWLIIKDPSAVGITSLFLAQFFGGIILVTYLPAIFLHLLQIKQLAMRRKGEKQFSSVGNG
jgi:hypothetical protein